MSKILITIHRCPYSYREKHGSLDIAYSKVVVQVTKAFFAAHAVRHKEATIAQYGAHKPWNTTDRQFSLVVPIASKYLITAIACQHDSDVLTCEFRDIVGRQHG